MHRIAKQELAELWRQVENHLPRFRKVAMLVRDRDLPASHRSDSIDANPCELPPPKQDWTEECHAVPLAPDLVRADEERRSGLPALNADIVKQLAQCFVDVEAEELRVTRDGLRQTERLPLDHDFEERIDRLRA